MTQLLQPEDRQPNENNENDTEAIDLKIIAAGPLTRQPASSVNRRIVAIQGGDFKLLYQVFVRMPQSDSEVETAFCLAAGEYFPSQEAAIFAFATAVGNEANSEYKSLYRDFAHHEPNRSDEIELPRGWMGKTPNENILRRKSKRLCLRFIALCVIGILAVLIGIAYPSLLLPSAVVGGTCVGLALSFLWMNTPCTWKLTDSAAAGRTCPQCGAFDLREFGWSTTPRPCPRCFPAAADRIERARCLSTSLWARNSTSPSLQLQEYLSAEDAPFGSDESCLVNKTLFVGSQGTIAFGPWLMAPERFRFTLSLEGATSFIVCMQRESFSPAPQDTSTRIVYRSKHFCDAAFNFAARIRSAQQLFSQKQVDFGDWRASSNHNWNWVTPHPSRVSVPAIAAGGLAAMVGAAAAKSGGLWLGFQVGLTVFLFLFVGCAVQLWSAWFMRKLHCLRSCPDCGLSDLSCSLNQKYPRPCPLCSPSAALAVCRCQAELREQL